MLKLISENKILTSMIALCLTAGVIFYQYSGGSKLSSNEIVITDTDFAEAEKKENIITDEDYLVLDEQITGIKASGQQPTKTLGDNSLLDISYDGYGNTIVTRVFNNHSRLSKIMMQISAKGKKQIYVFGQSGELGHLSQDLSDKVLNASADELANAAKIYETREERINQIEEAKRSRREQLKPLPSEEFPVYNENVEFPKITKPQPVTNDPTTTVENPELPPNPQSVKQNEQPDKVKQENDEDMD